MNSAVKDSKSKELIEFENALKQRNFEIDLFWKRSWFFGALILAEAAAFYKIKSDGVQFIPSSLVGFITMLTILAQCLMNRGSKYWQERWEYITMNREASLGIELTRLKRFKTDNFPESIKSEIKPGERTEWYCIDGAILAKEENAFAISRRFSVSKVIFLVWDLMFICSFLCWLNESYLIISNHPDWGFTLRLFIFYIVIIFYSLFFWKDGKIFEAYIKSLKNMSKNDIENMTEKYVQDELK
jgi:hypothetical protein